MADKKIELTEVDKLKAELHHLKNRVNTNISNKLRDEVIDVVSLSLSKDKREMALRLIDKAFDKYLEATVATYSKTYRGITETSYGGKL